MIRKNVRLGDALIEKGLLTNEALMSALALQKESGFSKKLGEILIETGYVTQQQLMQVLSEILKIELIDLFGVELNFKLIDYYPLHLLEKAKAIPVKEDSEYIYFATSDPLNYEAFEAIERIKLEKPIELYLAPDQDIQSIFERVKIIYKTKDIAAEVKKEITEDSYISENSESAITRLISTIVEDAIHRNASDIHIEPDGHEVSIRCRVDGILIETFVFDLDIYQAMASRIKILGNLDISEHRKAQDGRFDMEIDGGQYDFRLSTTPTLFGESIVMRILDQQKVLLKLNDLGLEEKNLESFSSLIHSPYGIILITGPTGSGKTTTLYATLNEIKGINNKVLTVEDPIEYQLPLIQQVQVNEKVGFTFFEALKSFLRQDPDIIMVGEIRDAETLNAATQAALTGHLVFSTLHTNDAPSAITRMNQMGLETYLIADALLAVVAQRLVRKNCPYCKTEYKPQQVLLKKIEHYLPENPVFYKGKGCPKCEMSGFSGRTMILEILEVNEKVSQMISKNSNKFEIAKVAEEEGVYRPMIQDALKKVMEGIIPLEEAMRVTRV